MYRRARLVKIGKMAEVARIDRRACKAGLA